MSRGDYASVLSNSGDVECLIWKDNKCVPFLNTIIKPGTEDSVNRKAKDGSRQAIKVSQVCKAVQPVYGWRGYCRCTKKKLQLQSKVPVS